MTRTTWISSTTDVPQEHIFIDMHGNQRAVATDSSDHYDVPPATRKRGAQVSGWKTVTHVKPQPHLTPEQERARELRKRERAEEMYAIMSDPVLAWKYKRRQRIAGEVKRLSKQQRYLGMPKRDLWQYVEGYISRSDEPTVIVNPKAAAERAAKEAKEQSRGHGSRRDAMVEQQAEEGNFVKKEFDREFIQRIKQTRASRTVPNLDGTERTMTQEDLGQLLSVNPGVIRDFEAGKLPFDGGLKSKLIWKLGLTIE